MRRSKVMRFAIDFAHFCSREELKPADAADLCQLASRVKAAIERAASERNAPDPAKAIHAFRQLAADLGYTADTGNPYPCLERDGNRVEIPCLP